MKQQQEQEQEQVSRSVLLGSIFRSTMEVVEEHPKKGHGTHTD